MDADRFDSLSKRVAAPTTRRATLGAMVASALGLSSRVTAAQADQGQVCTMDFVTTVRLGPSLNQTLPGGSQPGQLQGRLSFALAKDGNLQQAALTLANGTKLPVVGQATGHALQLRINLDGRSALVALGVGEADIAECKGAVDGTTSGPQVGDLGEWHARAQGLTGEPKAAGGGNKERGQSGAGGGGGNKNGGQSGGGGGAGSNARSTGQGSQGGSAGPLEPPAVPEGPKRKDRKTPTPTPNAAQPGQPLQCAAGQSLCNGGCADLQGNSENCGLCGFQCAAGETCVRGACQPSADPAGPCDAGLTRCGEVCVNIRNDQAHCGACGQACAAGVDCVNSTCGGSCPEGQTDCGDCADLMTDPAHCGDCFTACGAGVACINGVCGGEIGQNCPDGQVDCGGGCTDMNVDPTNCGVCGVVCAAGETCEAGFCTGANAGAGACLAFETDCGGVCVDTFTDPANCGGCGIACLAGEACNGGVCQGQVAPAALDCAGQGLVDCGGVCIDVTSDLLNCGGCGIACPAGEACLGSVCTAVADAPLDCASQGMTDCGGFCTDLTSDTANCGACGIACVAGDSCGGGICLAQAA